MPLRQYIPNDLLAAVVLFVYLRYINVFLIEKLAFYAIGQS